MDKETHLNLRQVPEDLLPALETHLSEVDTAKKASGTQPRLVPYVQLIGWVRRVYLPELARRTASSNKAGVKGKVFDTMRTGTNCIIFVLACVSKPGSKCLSLAFKRVKRPN